MPFEPRILRTDDQPADDAGAHDVRSLEAGSENWLPTELEALAEQLGEDSQHLSQKFPAPSYPAPKLAELAARMEQVAAAAESRRSSYRAWRGYAAAASMAASTLAAGLLIAVGMGWWTTGGTMVGETVNGNLGKGEMAAVSPAEKSIATPAISHAALNASTDARLATRDRAPSATGATLAVESSAPVLEPQDFMELDSVTQSAVADLVEDGQLQQGSISL